MNQDYKKLLNKKFLKVVVLCLCLCGIGLSIGMIFWIVYQKSNPVAGQKKYVSWAEKVIVDPQKLYPVTDVVDGDTIKVLISGHVITIRLLGINTPEVVDPRKPVECYGPEASAETKSLLTGKSVSISLNPNYERVDIYGRLLAYVRLVDPNDSSTTSLFVNEFLVKQGYAYEYTFNEKNLYQYQKQFKADEVEANNAKRGLWGVCDMPIYK